MAQPAPEAVSLLRVAVAGNPNSGKTTIFNKLTGLRQKVANYPGVTVERKSGRCQLDDQAVELLDLPGAYSLTATSPDEEIARDVLLGWQPGEPPPDLVVVVVDAANLERNLFLASQIIELGFRTIVVLNMIDLVEKEGRRIDLERLGVGLGAPVVATVARHGRGLDRLQATILDEAAAPLPPVRALPLEAPASAAIEALAAELAQRGVATRMAAAIALRLLVSPTGVDDARRRYGAELAELVASQRDALAAAEVRWDGLEAGARYAALRATVDAAAGGRPSGRVLTPTDRIDQVLTHRWLGPPLFLLSMAIVFQSLYTWAAPLMDGIEALVGGLGGLVRGWLPPGVLTDLLVDGVIAGVGGVLVFLPQIVFLFFFLGLLEETGYMARAAFIADRAMSRVGLHGRSFVPLLSSFACAIPGIMAARTIGSRRDRLTTILVAPLITCSARLPVYTLLIAAFVPAKQLWGPFGAQGLTLLALYLLGVVAAVAVAALFKRTLFRGPAPALLLELPPYRWPDWGNLTRSLWERAALFLRFAGSVILSLSILLWFLASFPRVDTSPAGEQAAAALRAAGQDPAHAELLATETANLAGRMQLEGSLMGRLGRGFEPLVRPLGWDWRIGVGILSAFAAREVLVSTFGVIFAVGDEAEATSEPLIERLRGARNDAGGPLFTPPVVASLLVFFALACQCMATVGIVVRETGGWKWALVMVGYMSALAYVGALATYHATAALAGA